jgi:tryptophan synthase beta chain
VRRQPERRDQAGREILEEDPDTPGQPRHRHQRGHRGGRHLDPRDTRYSLGSVLNHVLLHQTIIGLEAKKQFEKIGEYPDVVIGCAGGGSNFAGLASRSWRDKIARRNIRIMAAEPRLPDADARRRSSTIRATWR